MALTSDAIETLLAKASSAAVQPIPIETQTPIVLVQEGYDIRELEKFLARPIRVRQNVTLGSPQSFIDYCLRFGEPEAVVFIKDKTFAAILDYHGPIGSNKEAPTPSWATHRATYQPAHSHEWKKWKEQNEKAMTQEQFALFLEARQAEIKAPVAAKLMTAVLNFKEAAESTLTSAQNLSTGEVEYSFTRNNKPTKVVFPTEIVIQLPIFEHHDLVEVSLNVRRRVSNEGGLSIWYQFAQDPETLVRSYFETYCAKPIREKLGKKLALFEGIAG